MITPSAYEQFQIKCFSKFLNLSIAFLPRQTIYKGKKNNKQKQKTTTHEQKETRIKNKITPAQNLNSLFVNIQTIFIHHDFCPSREGLLVFVSSTQKKFHYSIFVLCSYRSIVGFVYILFLFC